MVVDAHVHVAGEPRIWGRSTGPRDRWKDKDFSPEAYVEAMDENGVDRAVLLPIAPYISNRYIAEVVDEFPDRFIGFASVVPQAWMAPSELEFAVEEYGLRGLKLHPRWQGFDPADPLVIPTLKKAAELRIPVFIHCRPAHSPKFSPLAIWNMLYHLTLVEPDLSSGLTVVLNHVGSFHFRDAISWAVDQQLAKRDRKFLHGDPEIYLEVSGFFSSIEGYGFDVVEEGEGPEFFSRVVSRYDLHRKFIFGSDWPFLPVKEGLDFIEEAGLDREKRDAILGDNILRILGPR